MEVAVERVLKELFGLLSIQYRKVLWGFPHPSGVNEHRKIQYEENRSNMIEILENYNI